MVPNGFRVSSNIDPAVAVMVFEFLLPGRYRRIRLGQLGHRRSAEQRGHGQFHLKRRTHPADHLGGQEGLAAEVASALSEAVAAAENESEES